MILRATESSPRYFRIIIFGINMGDLLLVISLFCLYFVNPVETVYKFKVYLVYTIWNNSFELSIYEDD